MEILKTKVTKSGSKYLSINFEKNNVTAFFTMRDTIVDSVFLEEVGLDNTTCAYLKQVHGDKIYKLMKKNMKRWEEFYKVTDEPYRKVNGIFCGDGDGMITNINKLLLTTIHADCLPIYFIDNEKGIIGLAHSGWKGTSLEISKKMVKAMVEEGAKINDIKAIIGPGISKCCFEVKDDVMNVFREKYGSEFIEKISERKDEEKYLLDLKSICVKQLKDAGVALIEVSDYCTACNLDKFYSYRAEGPILNRMVAGITIS